MASALSSLSRSAPKKASAAVANSAVAMPIPRESFTSPRASASYFGRTIAVGYPRAATVASNPVTDTKSPCRPIVSGPYRRVMNGAKIMPTAWAQAVPEATVSTLRIKGRSARRCSALVKVGSLDMAGVGKS